MKQNFRRSSVAGSSTRIRVVLPPLSSSELLLVLSLLPTFGLTNFNLSELPDPDSTTNLRMTLDHTNHAIRFFLEVPVDSSQWLTVTASLGST